MFTREAHPAVRRKEPARTHQRAGSPAAGSQTQPRRPTFQRGYFSASASPSEPQNSPAADREDFPPVGGRGKMNTREAEGRALAARDPQQDTRPAPLTSCGSSAAPGGSAAAIGSGSAGAAGRGGYRAHGPARSAPWAAGEPFAANSLFAGESVLPPGSN